MRISNFLKKHLMVLVAVVIAVFMSGCSIFNLIGKNNSSPTPTKKSMNLNGNNTIEITVSENEKFIVYFTEITDLAMSGYGEWIKDGVAIPIYFSDFRKSCDAPMRSFPISYAKGKGLGLIEEAQDYASASRGIAMFVYDEEDPQMKWCVKSYNWPHAKFSDGVPVTIKMYTREPTEKWNFVPDEWYSFITPADTGSVYTCAEANFTYNSLSNSGVWKYNDMDVPIQIEFDRENARMFVYDISGEKTQILTAQGYIQDEKTIIFNKYSGIMIYRDSIDQLTVKKSDIESN